MSVMRFIGSLVDFDKMLFDDRFRPKVPGRFKLIFVREVRLWAKDDPLPEPPMSKTTRTTSKARNNVFLLFLLCAPKSVKVNSALL